MVMILVKNIIPATMEKYNTYAYKFDGTWEDIGTIGAYFNSNIAFNRSCS